MGPPIVFFRSCQSYAIITKTTIKQSCLNNPSRSSFKKSRGYFIQYTVVQLRRAAIASRGLLTGNVRRLLAMLLEAHTNRYILLRTVVRVASLAGVVAFYLHPINQPGFRGSIIIASWGIGVPWKSCRAIGFCTLGRSRGCILLCFLLEGFPDGFNALLSAAYHRITSILRQSLSRYPL